MQHETLCRTVIFLDIDGVLQSPSSQKRFQHDLEELRRRLADDLDDAAYLDFDKYDLGAIYHDWDGEAVERLRTLCEDFGAEIVISSDWRMRKSVEMLQAYFRIHDLHRYVTDKTCESGGPPHYRVGEVKDYLDAHPEVERFVIIDDGYGKEFEELFPEQFVYTGSLMTDADAARARQILSSRRGRLSRLRQLGPLGDDNVLIFRDRTPKGRHYTARPGGPPTWGQDRSLGAGCLGNFRCR